ncbi:MAG: isochorismatase family protein [Parachlamydiaceae bacterium]
MGDLTLSREKAGLLIIDIQEKLFPHIDHPCELLDKVLMMVQGAKIIGLPIVVSEQNPNGLGRTIQPIRQLMNDHQLYHHKTSFSCLKNEELLNIITSTPVTQWILVGLEAHICVLQTAKDLIRHGFQVTILNDAVSSRSIYDFSTAIAEYRDIGARVTSTETILFELIEDAKDLKFKEISNLITKQTC